MFATERFLIGHCLRCSLYCGWLASGCLHRCFHRQRSRVSNTIKDIIRPYYIDLDNIDLCFRIRINFRPIQYWSIETYFCLFHNKETVCLSYFKQEETTSHEFSIDVSERIKILYTKL